MNKKIAIDTNVLVYMRDNRESRKFQIAMNILDAAPVVCSQVAVEYMNVLKRLFKLTKQECMEICLCDTAICEFHTVDYQTLKYASDLMLRYDFQLFDSIVVASALEANCDILYSEDFQHNQLVKNRLRIINPFI
ncbi:MAG: PIN domain-containing protein [Tannerella sp.]|jgi:predicted nucleic acid-binding protein|nr:PIN domain-containing protein [Tannerella sp.]